VGAVALLLGVALTPSPARACGPEPTTIGLLSPRPDARDVPTNVALLASINVGSPFFELRELMGNTSVPVSVNCVRVLDGNLCFGHPGPLRPDTIYAWSVLGSDEASPRIFRTGTADDVQAPFVNRAKVTITEREAQAPGPCGSTLSRSTLRVELPDLDESALLVPASIHGPAHLPAVLPMVGPAARTATLTLPDLDRCLAFQLVDLAGNGMSLPVLCPGTQPGGTAELGEPDGVQPAGGCSVGGGAGTAAPVVPVVLVAALLAGWRRFRPRG
jgi:hypothetical protein